MRTLIISTTLLLAVVAATSVGVAAGYAAVRGILLAFGHRPGQTDKPTPALEGVPAPQG